MILDNSDSMNGTKWDELIKQFNVFLKNLSDDEDLKLNSWLTVINYNTVAYKMFEEKEPNIDLIKGIQRKNGHTNFD